MPDITASLLNGALNPWTLLPLAVALGALHALEPGHAKSMMAAFIIAVRGTVPDAVLLGLSAAVGHSVVVWVLALIGWQLGDSQILAKAEPVLVLVSGLIVIGLALRMLMQMHGGGHGHGHDHEHGQGSHAPHDHGTEVAQHFAGRKVTKGEIIWFGLTGGLMPCPSAIAVLLLCWQIKASLLGVFMVFAFSFGLAATMVAAGIVAAWGAARAGQHLGHESKLLQYAPVVSGCVVLVLGFVMAARGILTL